MTKVKLGKHPEKHRRDCEFSVRKTRRRAQQIVRLTVSRIRREEPKNFPIEIDLTITDAHQLIVDLASTLGGLDVVELSPAKPVLLGRTLAHV